MVMSELSFAPDPATLQFWYFKQIRDFKPMSEDIAHYRRSQWSSSPDYSFEWLWAASCRYHGHRRADYMQDALNRSLNGAPNTAVPGVNAPGKGKRQW